MQYKSKIDLVPAVFLGTMLTFALVGGIVMLFRGHNIALGILGILFGLSLLATSVPTHYHLARQQLKIRSGLFRWKISTSTIQSVEYSSNPLFAPAWSLRRLRIEFINKNNQKDYLLISPADRAAFMKELVRVESRLVRNGERIQKIHND